MTYIQCQLRREGLVSVVGLPGKFAVVGKRIRLPDGGDDWIVEQVWRTFLPENRRSYQFASIQGEPLK